MEREPGHKTNAQRKEARLILKGGVLSALSEIAEIEGVSLADAFKIMLGRQLFIEGEVDKGSQILVRQKRKFRPAKTRQIIFPNRSI